MNLKYQRCCDGRSVILRKMAFMKCRFTRILNAELTRFSTITVSRLLIDSSVKLVTTLSRRHDVMNQRRINKQQRHVVCSCWGCTRSSQQSLANLVAFRGKSCSRTINSTGKPLVTPLHFNSSTVPPFSLLKHSTSPYHGSITL